LEKKKLTENKTAAKEGKKDAPTPHIYKKEFSGGKDYHQHSMGNAR